MDSSDENSDFVPEIHLAPLTDPIEHISLADLGYSPTVYSPIAASKITPLFTAEAIRRIRAEVVDRDTLATHMYSDNNSPCVVRGHCPDKGRFTYNAWTHPEVVKRINEMAGIPITPVYDYEIGHTNIQLGPRGWQGLKPEPDLLVESAGDLVSDEEISPTLFRGLNWHKDSYPFVCILMLSDMPTNAGGNTIVRKADESNYICELPRMGQAMVLQGGRLDHAVSPTTTPLERLTMITSYRPVDPLAPDTCVLSTVRAVSDNSVLLKQWIDYRMKVLAARAEKFAQLVKPEVYAIEMAKFTAEQTLFLNESLSQMTSPISRTPTDARAHYLTWAQSQNVILAM